MSDLILKIDLHIIFVARKLEIRLKQTINPSISRFKKTLDISVRLVEALRCSYFGLFSTPYNANKIQRLIDFRLFCLANHKIYCYTWPHCRISQRLWIFY